MVQSFPLPPSSRGLGRSPFKAKTGVRIPVGAHRNAIFNPVAFFALPGPVELHQGQVEITSLPGQGACVSIRLPLFEYAIPAPTLPKPAPGFSR
jgi:hypothetical protein